MEEQSEEAEPQKIVRKLSNAVNAWRTKRQRSSSTASYTTPMHTVNRPVFTQQLFDKGFTECPPQRSRVRKYIKHHRCDCSRTFWKTKLYHLFPFVDIMRNYSWRENLSSDVISGLTVGIMNIPQGMGYALLASLSPIYGLYTSFFPVLIYFLFGGSKHISIGTFAVTSLMVANTVEPLMDRFTIPTIATSDTVNLTVFNSYNISSEIGRPAPTDITDDRMGHRIGLVMTLALMVGLIQIVMGVFRLGFITIYLADPLISGFTTGSACHVLTSQVKFVFGVNVTSFKGPFNLGFTYIDFFKKISTTNMADLVITVVCLVILITTKECINERYRAKLKMPIPIDFIVVVLGIIISYFGKFEKNFNVRTLSNIPLGFPAPKAPPMEGIVSMLPGAFVIAVVAFAISISLSKMYARKCNYEVHANQELLALGLTNSIGSFFSCIPSCGSLSRTAIQVNSGGKTQLAGLVSCVLIAIVLTVLGPYCEPLPNSVLASIIIVALKGMLFQFRELKKLWFISGFDFSIWLITFAAVILVDVDLGLAIGVLFGLLTVVFRTQFPHTCILARVLQTDIYKDKKVYPMTQEVPGIKIFRIDASLWYANVEHFRKRLYKQTGLNPRALKLDRLLVLSTAQKSLKKTKREAQQRHLNPASGQTAIHDQEAVVTLYRNPSGQEFCALELAKQSPDWPKPAIHHLIIDCGSMSYVDSVGISMLRTVYHEYKDVDVEVMLVNCKAAVRDMFRRCQFYDEVPPENVLLTVHDAVIVALGNWREIRDKIFQDTKIVSVIDLSAKHEDPQLLRMRYVHQLEINPDIVTMPQAADRTSEL